MLSLTILLPYFIEKEKKKRSVWLNTPRDHIWDGVRLGRGEVNLVPSTHRIYIYMSSHQNFMTDPPGGVGRGWGGGGWGGGDTYE